MAKAQKPGRIPATDDDHLYAGLQQRRRQALETTVSQVEWLLLTVVLLYALIPGAYLGQRLLVISTMVVFALMILVFHYVGLRRVSGLWKTLFEICAMLVVVSVVVRHSGYIESPLLSLYFLVIIVTASTAGIGITMAMAALISAAYLYLASMAVDAGSLTEAGARLRLLQLFPFWLVAYLASMFAYEAEHSRLQLARMAHTDSLTELWNMRMFANFAEQEFARSRRYQRPFSIIMFDADNLKTVNDRFGHQAGSAMIQVMGRLLKENLRASDVVARYGGDEFIIMLPETPAEMAFLTAERIRCRLAESALPPPARNLSFSGSAGVAAFPVHGSELNGIIRKADAALYQSKRGGKNRVSIYAEMIADGV
ncbi:MAG: GGDEF domain-containing protein [Deltaproteobacteria bacterium]|nr:GGDEF domain-containing protein [Deltaproteobacteria bacterium]